MGTRADFYVGRGPDAEWLGSIAWDGYPDGIPEALRASTSERIYRQQLEEFLANREDTTRPEQGWPWPWETSHTTDYAYAYDDTAVFASCFGSTWFDALNEPEDVDEVEGDAAVFPDMSERKAVTYGSRSGVMLIGAAGPIPAADIDAQEARRAEGDAR